MHGIDLCLIALACWLAWELGARVLAVWRRVRRYRALMQKRRIRQIARTRSESSLANADLSMETLAEAVQTFDDLQPGKAIHVDDVSNVIHVSGAPIMLCTIEEQANTYMRTSNKIVWPDHPDYPKGLK